MANEGLMTQKGRNPEELKGRSQNLEQLKRSGVVWRQRAQNGLSSEEKQRRNRTKGCSKDKSAQLPTEMIMFAVFPQRIVIF